jgi:hypothetical protein
LPDQDFSECFAVKASIRVGFEELRKSGFIWKEGVIRACFLIALYIILYQRIQRAGLSEVEVGGFKHRRRGR